jgi:hypothetical protein
LKAQFPPESGAQLDRSILENDVQPRNAKRV